MLRVKVIKVGNHWYLNVPHDYEDMINFNKKIDRILNKIDFGEFRSLTIRFQESDDLKDKTNRLYFDENDVYQYMTSTDFINMRFVINDHEFYINSDVYWILENTFNFDFHKKSYQIEIY